jgi:hypothetical protein
MKVSISVTIIEKPENLLSVKPLIHQSELRTYTKVVLKSCSEIPCSGTSPTLKIATSFPEIQYLYVMYQNLHKGLKYN